MHMHRYKITLRYNHFSVYKQNLEVGSLLIKLTTKSNNIKKKILRHKWPDMTALEDIIKNPDAWI